MLKYIQTSSILVLYWFTGGKGRIVKYLELKKSLSNKINNVYLISGEDRFLCYSALNLITKSANLSNDQLNLVNIDGNCSVDEIVASANCFPFMDDYRVVVVKDFSGKNVTTKQKDKLVDYINNPLKSTILVFFNLVEDGFFKNLKNSLCFVDCSKIDSKSAAGYINNRLKEANCEIDSVAVNLIAEYCLCDMQRINQETEKLIAYSFASKKITADDVKSLVVKDKEYQIYELADFLANGKGMQANDLVDSLSKKSGFNVLTPLYNNYRRALYISINSATPDSSLAQNLGIKEYAVKMTKNQVKAFSPKKLKQIVDMLKDMDANIKKGKIKEDIAVKLAISNILKLRNKI